MHRNTYVEINLSSIYHNIKKVMEISPSYHYYFGVVKADGYGHGVEIVETLLQAGINYLAVATLDEALEIRKDFKECMKWFNELRISSIMLKDQK